MRRQDKTAKVNPTIITFIAALLRFASLTVLRFLGLNSILIYRLKLRLFLQNINMGKKTAIGSKTSTYTKGFCRYIHKTQPSYSRKQKGGQAWAS